MQNKNNQYTINKENNKQIKRDFMINYNIRSYQVRLIEDGQPAKILQRDIAINIAESRGLDLVQISFDKVERLPICKIIDYGKYKYEQAKKEKEAKKLAKANVSDIKTIQFSITTDDNDKTRLINQAKVFLSKGDKVKISIRFRNKRESTNLNFAKNIMLGILTNFETIAILDSNPALNGRELACILRKAN